MHFMSMFFLVKQRGTVSRYQCFGGAYRLHLQVVVVYYLKRWHLLPCLHGVLPRDQHGHGEL